MKTRAHISIILFSFVVLSIISCSQNKSEKDISGSAVYNPITADGSQGLDQLPKFEFNDTIHDFGTVIKGERVSYGFKFKNVGKSDLIIAKVSASCGCTAASYPTKPIKPGEESVIKIMFNSEGREGFQNKSAQIVANTQPNVTNLRIKAKVITPESMNN